MLFRLPYILLLVSFSLLIRFFPTLAVAHFHHSPGPLVTNIDDFRHLCRSNQLEIKWEKNKLLVMSNFIFFNTLICIKSLIPKTQTSEQISPTCFYNDITFNINHWTYSFTLSHIQQFCSRLHWKHSEKTLKNLHKRKLNC